MKANALRKRALATSALLAGTALCSACVQLRFERETRLEPVPQGALAALEPGRSDLRAALERLGPPNLAWELPAGGSALGWGWYHEFGWRLRASDSLKRGLSVSFDYSSDASRLYGAVLFFDGDWRLTGVREGLLGELRKQSRARPAALDEE